MLTYQYKQDNTICSTYLASIPWTERVCRGREEIHWSLHETRTFPASEAFLLYLWFQKFLQMNFLTAEVNKLIWSFHVTFTLFSLCVRSLEIRFVKMVSSAYTVIFSFSNAEIILQKSVLHVFWSTIHHFARCIKLKIKLFFIHHQLLAPFVDSYYSPRGQHDRTPGRFYYRKFTGFWAEFGYGKYLIVPFWYASAAYQARLVSPWVFWLDQTRLICRRSVPKRYD